MLNEEVRHARGQVDRRRGRHRSAVVVRSDRDVISLRQYGDAARAANPPMRDIGPYDVDESLAQQRLEHACVADPAPESQRRHGLARNLAHRLEIGHGTRLVEPERVETLDGPRDGCRIAGSQRTLSAQHEVAILRQLFDQRLHLVLIGLALVAGGGFWRRDRDGAECRLRSNR